MLKRISKTSLRTLPECQQSQTIIKEPFQIVGIWIFSISGSHLKLETKLTVWYTGMFLHSIQQRCAEVCTKTASRGMATLTRRGLTRGPGVFRDIISLDSMQNVFSYCYPLSSLWQGQAEYLPFSDISKTLRRSKHAGSAEFVWPWSTIHQAARVMPHVKPV